MRLGEKQELFARLLPLLIQRAHELGYEVRLKELLRGPEQAIWNSRHCGTCKETRRAHVRADVDHEFHAIGIVNSLHCVGLAIDLVLFNEGQPLWATKRYRQLGEYWESLHELCFWGGPTPKPGDRLRRDGMHFALTHESRQ